MARLNGPFVVVHGSPPWWREDALDGPKLGQDMTMATVWAGPTPLILGPGSWGFGIAPSQGTAALYPRELPKTVQRIF